VVFPYFWILLNVLFFGMSKRSHNEVSILPFADQLIAIFSPENVIVRTHFPRFLDYIKTSTAIHQFQRKTDEEGYVIAKKEDYDYARMALAKTTNNILMIPLTKIQSTILKQFEVKNIQNQGLDEIQELEEIGKLDIHIEWLRRQLN